MNPTLRRLSTIIISLALIVAPLRAGWAGSFDAVAADTATCHMVTDAGTVAATDGEIQSSDSVQPPCCRVKCDGCDGNCDARSSMGAVLISLLPMATFPASVFSRHADSAFEPVHTKPLLRPPPHLLS